MKQKIIRQLIIRERPLFIEIDDGPLFSYTKAPGVRLNDHKLFGFTEKKKKMLEKNITTPRSVGNARHPHVTRSPISTEPLLFVRM